MGFTDYMRMAPFLVAGLASGCKYHEEKRELSDILHEEARVVDVVYTPPRHGSGSGIGPTIDFSGNIGISITDVDVEIPPAYAVVFECQHGKFISQGTDETHKKLWDKLKEGQRVEVTYRELFDSVYEDPDKDDKPDLVKRTLVGYDFLDAVPQQ